MTTLPITTTLKTLALAALLLGSTAPAFADGSAPAKKAEAPVVDIAAALESFKEATKDAEEPKELANALTTLAASGHYKAAAQLARYLAHRSDVVAEAAINGLGALGASLELKYKPYCTRPLLPVLRLDERNPFRAKAAVAALEKIGDARIAAVLVGLVDSDNLDVAKAAVVALKTLKHRDSIDPLVKVLVKLEWAPKGRGGDGSSGGTPVGYGRGGLGNGLAERINALKAPVLETLAAITGERFSTSLDYRKWWKDNQRTFRIERPEDAPTVERR